MKKFFPSSKGFLPPLNNSPIIGICFNDLRILFCKEASIPAPGIVSELKGNPLNPILPKPVLIKFKNLDTLPLTRVPKKPNPLCKTPPNVNCKSLPINLPIILKTFQKPTVTPKTSPPINNKSFKNRSLSFFKAAILPSDVNCKNLSA